MKRITFIEPVGTMQGKLSGNRKLTYPTRNNSAWQAPEGKSYATNYRPSYIGNLRVKDGVTYFSTKVRSSVTMNASTRLAQALLGASASLTSSMLKNPQILQIVTAAYIINEPKGQTLSQWCTSQVRLFLEDHSDFYFISSTGFKYIQNPFIGTHSAGSIAITSVNEAIVTKFWPQLASDGITFTINGKEGIAFYGEHFSQLAASSHNTLGLTISSGNVFMGDLYVKYNDVNVEDGDEVVNGRAYTAGV